jgi:large conductance mechanosensitive channel
MKSFFNDFKKFITRGSVLDLAVAVVIGAAFNRIVQSLVKDIITPVISLVTGKTGFENYKYVITEANFDQGIAENAIMYGVFIQNILDFVFIAFVIYIIIHFINQFQDRINERKQKEEKERNEQIAQEKKAEASIQSVKPQVEDILLDIKVLLEKQSQK